MKISVGLLVAPLILVPGLAFAHGDGKGPCLDLRKACKDAGFTRGGHKQGKGLVVDCMKNLLDGKTVEGVKVETAQVNACKEAKEKHQAKKAGA